MRNWLNTWFTKKEPVYEIKVRLKKKYMDRLNDMLTGSEHNSLAELLGEALNLSETIYEYSGNRNLNVICQIVDGKIATYIEVDDDDGGDDGGGGGGGEPIPVENAEIINLFKKAA